MNYTYNCILIDDIETDLIALESEIHKFNTNNHHGINIIIDHKCLDINDAVFNLNDKISLIFLDLRYGDSFKKLGEGFLRNIRPNTKVIVVSGFIEPNINTTNFPNIICCLDKNNRYTDLADAIVEFWIIQERIRSIFGKNSVRIFLNGKWIDVRYNEVHTITTGLGRVIINMRNGDKHDADANLISLSRFDSMEPLLRIANHVTVNQTEIESISEQRNKNTRRTKLQIVLKGDKKEILDVGPFYERDVTIFAIRQNLPFNKC